MVPTNLSQKAFALGRSHWRFENTDSKVVQCSIYNGREYIVPVVDEETVRMIEGQEFAELLDRPFRIRVFGHV